MQKGKGGVGVAIVILGFDQYREFENSAVLRRWLGRGGAADRPEHQRQGSKGDAPYRPWRERQPGPIHRHLPFLA